MTPPEGQKTWRPDPVIEHIYATLAAALLDRPFSYLPAQHPSNLMRVQ